MRRAFEATVLDVVRDCGERGDHARWTFLADGEARVLAWYTRVELDVGPGDRVHIVATEAGDNVHPGTGARELLIERAKISKAG